MEYFVGDPPSCDPMWIAEFDSVARYCVGRGLDPGAGSRTFSPETIRADLRVEHRPHVVADAMALPFRHSVFDFVINAHLIEHLLRPIDAIREWLRVVRPGGYICMIVPDTRFTMAANTDATPHRYEWSPREFLEHVCGWHGAYCQAWVDARGPITSMSAEIVEAHMAAPNWSFAVILRRCEEKMDGEDLLPRIKRY